MRKEFMEQIKITGIQRTGVGFLRAGTLLERREILTNSGRNRRTDFCHLVYRAEQTHTHFSWWNNTGSKRDGIFRVIETDPVNEKTITEIIRNESGDYVSDQKIRVFEQIAKYAILEEITDTELISDPNNPEDKTAYIPGIESPDMFYSNVFYRRV